MAANTVPIFPIAGQISWGTLATANTAKDGTGTIVTVFTADATNGSRVDSIIVRPKGTNVASVLRVFINNGSDNATATNNTLYTERTLPASTLSEVAELSGLILTMNLVLPAGYKLNCTIGTTIAAGVAVTAVGGKY